jgi:transposase
MSTYIFLAPLHTVEQLSEAYKKECDPITKMRLRVILLRKKGKNPKEIVNSLLISGRAIHKWVSLYNNGGIEGLNPKPSGRTEGNPKWDTSIFDKLIKEIDKGGYWSIPKMQDWIQENLKETIPEQTVWYHLDKLKYSYKSARPHPVQGNKDKQDVFKKGALLRSWSR